jgi:hypothetical protein
MCYLARPHVRLRLRASLQPVSIYGQQGMQQHRSEGVDWMFVPGLFPLQGTVYSFVHQMQQPADHWRGSNWQLVNTGVLCACCVPAVICRWLRRLRGPLVLSLPTLSQQ